MSMYKKTPKKKATKTVYDEALSPGKKSYLDYLRYDQGSWAVKKLKDKLSGK